MLLPSAAHPPLWQSLAVTEAKPVEGDTCVGAWLSLHRRDMQDWALAHIFQCCSRGNSLQQRGGLDSRAVRAAPSTWKSELLWEEWRRLCHVWIHVSLPWDCHPDDVWQAFPLGKAQCLARGYKYFQWNKMSNHLLTSKKNNRSLRIKWCPPVSDHNQVSVQKLLPWGCYVSPAPGVSHHPWAEAKPCPSLCLQNVHSSSCQLQTAVARELWKVKKTAKDEGRAAAEGWQAAAGEGGGEGGREAGGSRKRKNWRAWAGNWSSSCHRETIPSPSRTVFSHNH